MSESLIDQFDAQAEDGQTFTVLTYRRMVPFNGQWLPGSTRFALSDGRNVNVVDAMTFKIVATDQVIRKID